MLNKISKASCIIGRWLILIFMAASVSALNAQGQTVTGKVIDENGNPVIGATVLVMGTSTGTTTDQKGVYRINAAAGNVIQVSFLGYKTEEATVGARTMIDFSLVPVSSVLEDVVVIGYGTVRRKDLTGSVSSVSGGTIEGFKSSSVASALGGQVAGLQITQTDGSPGAGLDIKIRGVGTITGDASPLFIVDGFQVDNIDYLSNNDIESIDVLKDASASAIYGARAANGVILVTTKSGREGKPVINFSASTSYRTITRSIDMLNPYEFVELQMELNPDRYQNTYFREGVDDYGVPYRYQSIDDYRGLPGVDWQKDTFRPTWSYDTNASIQGGKGDTKYTASFSRYNEDGIFLNSGFEKTGVKLRINQKINNWLSFDATVNYVNSLREGAGTSAEQGRFNMLGMILRARPTGGLAMSDEEFRYASIDPLELEYESNLAQVNPIVQTESVTNNVRSEAYQGNLAVTVKLLPNLTFRSSGSYWSNHERRDTFYKEGSKEAYRNGESPYGFTSMSRKKNYSNNNYLNYIFKSSGHRLEVMLGEEIVVNKYESLLGESRDYPTDHLGNDNLGLGATPTRVTSSYTEKTLLSFFSRVNYNFGEKYLLTATIRSDGSSVFSANNKWAWSPSVSAAWRIKEESFMEDVEFITNLKLRAGWGIVGNDRIASYLSLPLYTTNRYGAGGTLTTVLSNKHLPNADLRWEGSQTTNLGLDLGFFKNRLSVTVDAFLKDTKDLLLARNLPYTSGFGQQYYNIGKIRNKGLEITVNSVNVHKGAFMWTTDLNISFIRNELRALEDGQSYMLDRANYDGNVTSYDYIARIGQPLGLMYGYIYDGVYQLSDFNYNASTGQYVLKEDVVDISDHYGSPVQPGVVKYKDLDNDGKITEADRDVIGNGQPKWFGGVTNSFSFKGIDLSFMFQFSYGNDIYNATRLFINQSDLERYNMAGEVRNRWQHDNASSVPSAKGYIRNDVYSRFVEDGSFLRLKNLTLGYTLPPRITRKARIDKLRVYFSGQNLFVVSGYSGYDPEVSMRSSNPLTPGVDWGAYPRSRVFTFGIDVQF